MTRAILIVAVVVACIAARTNALECYSCSSLLNGNCADKFSATNVEKDSSCTACLKIKANDMVLRACGTGSNGCTEAEVLGVKTATCICTDALCNVGNHVTVTMGAMLLGTAVVLLKALF